MTYKDKTVAQQQHSTVIPELSRANILQHRQSSEKILCVCLCGRAWTCISTFTHAVLFIFTVPIFYRDVTTQENPVCDQQ